MTIVDEMSDEERKTLALAIKALLYPFARSTNAALAMLKITLKDQTEDEQREGIEALLSEHLIRFIVHSNTNGVNALLAAGANPNATAPQAGGVSALELARKSLRPDLADILIQYGADPNARTDRS